MEIIPDEEESLYPVLQLRSEDQEKFEIRIVIWHVEDLPSDKGINV
jgi:hypothetical protein